MHPSHPSSLSSLQEDTDCSSNAERAALGECTQAQQQHIHPWKLWMRFSKHLRRLLSEFTLKRLLPHPTPRTFFCLQQNYKSDRLACPSPTPHRNGTLVTVEKSTQRQHQHPTSADHIRITSHHISAAHGPSGREPASDAGCYCISHSTLATSISTALIPANQSLIFFEFHCFPFSRMSD